MGEGENNNACNAKVKSWVVHNTSCDHVLDLAMTEVWNENVADVQS